MPAPHAGGCICGEVRYAFDGEPLTLYACHCTECQTRTGSAFALSLFVSREVFKVEKGEPVLRDVTMADGRHKRGRFCTVCGTRLWGEPLKLPDAVIIGPGTLDDTSWLRPVAHIWTRSAQPWFQFPKDAILFEQQPPHMELRRLWQQRAASSR